jgi:hypothetical protein
MPDPKPCGQKMAFALLLGVVKPRGIYPAYSVSSTVASGRSYRDPSEGKKAVVAGRGREGRTLLQVAKTKVQKGTFGQPFLCIPSHIPPRKKIYDSVTPVICSLVIFIDTRQAALPLSDCPAGSSEKTRPHGFGAMAKQIPSTRWHIIYSIRYASRHLCALWIVQASTQPMCSSCQQSLREMPKTPVSVW